MKSTHHLGDVAATIRGEAWLVLENPARSMEDARRSLEEAGNVILEEDRVRRRFKVLDEEVCQDSEVWACDYCGAYSRDRGKVEEHEARCI